MGIQGCAVCAKWTLFALMILFCLIGIFFVVCGALIYNSYTFFSGFTNAVPTGAVVLILLGIGIFVISVVGMVGAFTESYCAIMSFAVLMGVIFILEIAAGVAGFVISQEVFVEMQSIMNNTMSMYNTNANQIGQTWDTTQVMGHCCGVVGPSDWAGLAGNNSNTVPDSCCVSYSAGCGYNALLSSNQSSVIYTVGCSGWLEYGLAYGAFVIGITAIVVSLVELGSIICACIVAREIQVGYNML